MFNISMWGAPQSEVACHEARNDDLRCFFGKPPNPKPDMCWSGVHVMQEVCIQSLTQRVLSTHMGYTYPNHKGNYYYRNHTLYHIGTLDPLGYSFDCRQL